MNIEQGIFLLILYIYAYIMYITMYIIVLYEYVSHKVYHPPPLSVKAAIEKLLQLINCVLSIQFFRDRVEKLGIWMENENFLPKLRGLIHFDILIKY